MASRKRKHKEDEIEAKQQTQNSQKKAKTKQKVRITISGNFHIDAIGEVSSDDMKYLICAKENGTEIRCDDCGQGRCLFCLMHHVQISKVEPTTSEPINAYLFRHILNVLEYSVDD